MPYKILLVDDSPLLRRDLELKFRSSDFKLITAESWSEAKLLLKDISPDSFILDFHLQDDLTANDCLAEFEKLGCSDVPVILMSADPAIIKKVYANHPQVKAYIAKPVRPAEIEKVLRSVFAHSPPDARITETRCRKVDSLKSLKEAYKDIKPKTKANLLLPDALQILLANGYSFVEKIGGGGMSDIFRLRQKSLDRDVVLKVLSKRNCSNDMLVRRFSREARVLASLSHPNLVTVYNRGVEGGRPYILMEYVDGNNLRKYIENDETGLDFSLEVLLQLGAALSYLHQKGIIHRDLKPSNIIVSKTGAIKLIDFGLVKANTHPSVPLTSKGDVIGTPEYMSPEQAMGLPVDARSDIYSLGLIFYELLAKTPPFQGSFPEETIYMQRNVEHIPLCKQNEKIRKSISDIVDKMLKKNPRYRFQTVNAFLKRLRMEKFLTATKEARDKKLSHTEKMDISEFQRGKNTRAMSVFNEIDREKEE